MQGCQSKRSTQITYANSVKQMYSANDCNWLRLDLQDEMLKRCQDLSSAIGGISAMFGEDAGKRARPHDAEQVRGEQRGKIIMNM
jgi:hypothetical protein